MCNPISPDYSTGRLTKEDVPHGQNNKKMDEAYLLLWRVNIWSTIPLPQTSAELEAEGGHQTWKKLPPLKVEDAENTF
jgi:hypothetical protein